MNIPQILERVGLRPTLPRVVVLELFQQHIHHHFGAEEVYKRLNETTRNVSLASVYWALSQLTSAQLLSGVIMADGRLAYELNDGHRHDHLVCSVCGDVREFFDAGIEMRQREIAGDFGFELSGRPLVLFGFCAECRKRRARDSRETGV